MVFLGLLYLYYLFNVIKEHKFRRWAKRVLTLYFFWMLFYVYFWFKLSNFSVEEIVTILKQIVFGYHHLWYLIAMFYAGYLLYKIGKYSNTMLLGLAIFFFIIGVYIDYLNNTNALLSSSLEFITKDMNYHRNFLFIGFPFMTIGFLIKRSDFKIKTNLNMLLLFITFILLYIEVKFNLMITTNNLADIKSYNGNDIYILLLLCCPFVFVLFNSFQIKGKFDSRYLAMLSSGIYLIHPFIKSIVQIFLKNSNTLLTVCVVFISVFVSIMLIYFNKRLKINII